MTEETSEIRLPSRIEAIDDAANAAAEVARRAGFDEEALFGIDMAVREAVTNAVLHGNEQDETKHVDIRFTNSRQHLEIKVRDRGKGFDPDDVPDPTAPLNILKTSGRGLLFMRAYMDEIEYARHEQGGTVVRMLKRR
ncbi:MAG: ATP-binding protein [Pyrinomonadaceae bacterium]